MTTKDKLIEKLEELIECYRQQLIIMGDNKNTDVIKYIGLHNLNKELTDEIASLKSELAKEHQIAEEEKTDSDKKWKNPDCALDLLAFNCGRECSCANCPEYRGEY